MNRIQLKFNGFYLIPLIAFLVLAFFLWRGLSLKPHQLPSALIGKPVPEFSEADLFNPDKPINQHIFNGKVSVLNVWATWCVACHAEHSVLMDISEHYKVPIIGLNYKDQRAKALSWLQRFGDPYQKVIFDPQGLLGINLGVYGAPETFIIDRKGIIRYKYIGPISPQAWQDDIWPEVQKLRQRT